GRRRRRACIVRTENLFGTGHADHHLSLSLRLIAGATGIQPMNIDLQTTSPLSSAAIQTQQPERLMTRLCKHWGHKFPVQLEEQQASIELPMGICRMLCTDILQVE